MSYPLREHLELFTGPQGPRIRCTKCGHIFCRAGEDWKQVARVQLLPPTQAGPLMNEFTGKYLLQQSTCPTCGVLLDTDLIEEKKDGDQSEEKPPRKPEPKAIEASSKTTAILVLDVSGRCEDPKQHVSALLPSLGQFLERARAAAVPIIFTISASIRGTPMDKIAQPLRRRESEPVIYPDGFDKFVSGELIRILEKSGRKSVIILGGATNVAVLYTATTAARIHRYEVIVPVDGVAARTRYADEYSLHQLSVLPGGVNKRIRFTTLPMIRFLNRSLLK